MEESKWISVEDRLPEGKDTYNGFVEVYFDNEELGFVHLLDISAYIGKLGINISQWKKPEPPK